MNLKQHFNPVRLVMGEGAINTLGQEISRYGNKCLLVAQTNNDAMIEIKDKIANILKESNIEFDVFSDIRPNPLISDIKKGIQLIKENHYDVVVAVGGGSVIDTAKVLSISNEYEIDWTTVFSLTQMMHNPKKLPLFSIPTTAGTGSHCTQAAVISDENNTKRSVYSFDFFSTVAFVDYTLTLSLPTGLTASGFDAFCHLSESYIMGRLSPIMEMFNVEAMKKAVDTLPKLVKENKKEYREIMSTVDSSAGICLSNGGAIIPHAFGEAISSTAYRINHGCSLAICYPSFVEHFYENDEYGQRIKDVISILNNGETVEEAKKARLVMENFITSIGMKYTLADFDATEEEKETIKNILLSQKRFKQEDVAEIIEDICK